jgi:hypothetical protein
MTDIRKVRPVAPLDAWPIQGTERINGSIARWQVELTPRQHLYSDAEFAAAFMPAELFDAVLDAALDVDKWWQNNPKVIAPDGLLRVLAANRAALTAHDAARTEEGL